MSANDVLNHVVPGEKGMQNPGQLVFRACYPSSTEHTALPYCNVDVPFDFISVLVCIFDQSAPVRDSAYLM